MTKYNINMKTESEKLIEYIQVETRILRISDPRTKGVRGQDWEGYNKELHKLLIAARPIDINEIKNISNEYNVPFFREGVVEVVTKWNQLIANDVQ